MLIFLQSKATDRKLRLFAVGCCQSVRDYLWTQFSDQAIQLAERYADQLVKVEELETVQSRIVSSLELYGDEPIYDASYWACWKDAEEAAATCAWYARNNSTRQVEWGGPDGEGRCSEVAAKEDSKQANLLREVFGNPFCPSCVDPFWLSSTVTALAQAIYEDRAFDRLPILADALEDAGCTDAGILTHCRGSGPHVRGCWVVDLLLGKE